MEKETAIKICHLLNDDCYDLRTKDIEKKKDKPHPNPFTRKFKRGFR